jgi:hypothetical protein
MILPGSLPPGAVTIAAELKCHLYTRRSKMNSSEHTDRGQELSQLFLVRLWKHATNGSDIEIVESGGGSLIEIEWCGKLQHVVSGQAHYFRGWPTLIDLLEEMAKTNSVEVGANTAITTEMLP